MLNFEQINGFEKGQRESFEELVCILAGRNRPPGGKEYRRIEGKGGDGGVESVWITEGGGKIGYQAKFFPKNMTSDEWRQIDKSVRSAIKNHPDLARYIVALPCNLTPRALKKWDERRKEWEQWPEEKGSSIEFELWSLTDLNEMLYRDENLGLITHWFGKKVLNIDWFKNQVAQEIETLGARYSPGDHVEVSVAGMFDTLVRGPSTRSKITDLYSSLSENSVPDIDFSEVSADLVKKTRGAWQSLLATESVFTDDFTKSWRIEPVQSEIENLLEGLHEIQNSLYNEKGAADDHSALSLQFAKNDIQDAISACYDLRAFLGARALLAEQCRAAVIFGPAGSGKSHLLARIAEKSMEGDSNLAILLLGQKFSEQELWTQMKALLGFSLDIDLDELLSTINVAGERVGKRVLILIDAINEGVGCQYWKINLPSLLARIKKYPYLACVLSCREGYLEYAVPESVLEKNPRFYVGGFQTPEEMEQAARVYLDSQGISRPITLWLSPEFSNPLFLKSASKALQAKGLSEFPQGLRGISELMSFYLDSLSESIDLHGLNKQDLSHAIKKSAKAIAGKMAESGKDFVEIGAAKNLIDECFVQISRENGTSWLDILTREDVLRRDPPLSVDDTDPLDPPPEVVRFAFQRFQDYLMALSLSEMISKSTLEASFGPSGALQFLFQDIDPARVFWHSPARVFWHSNAGLIGELSTIFPEKFGIEFAHALPKKFNFWRNDYVLQEAFAKSVKWRIPSAFSKESHDLFASLNDDFTDRMELMLEVSIIPGHPLNALRLHRLLIAMPMPERDSFWTRWVNESTQRDKDQVNRIISWAETSQNEKTDAHHQELAAIILTWLLSSSCRTIRDGATKALTTILLRRPEIFVSLTDKFCGKCDDPYVIERLLAAGFGACCLDQSEERLETCSSKVFEHVFADGRPPVALLTRDYAAGIIELAEARGALPDSVDTGLCYPPYESDAPVFDLNEKEVKALAERCGGMGIFLSVVGRLGDFGIYTVPGRVRSFLTAPIEGPKPVSVKEWKANNTFQHQLWVAKRAFDFGWTSELFPKDSSGAYESRYENNLERIGKKYQRIALDELVARLADNFWYLNEWPEYPMKYRYPHQGFNRNIEPTILPHHVRYAYEDAADLSWMTGPKIVLPEVSEERREQWPFEQDPSDNFFEKLVREDENKNRWLVLYEFNESEDRYNLSGPASGFDLRLQEFRFFFCVFVKKQALTGFVNSLKKEGSLNTSDFSPRDFYDGPFLFEAFWRNTWEDDSQEEYDFSIPLANFIWESHSDRTLPDGFRARIPQKWFADDLKITQNYRSVGAWSDQDGRVLLQSTPPMPNHQSVVVIDEKTLSDYAEHNDVVPVWLLVAERNTWPLGGDGGCSCWRRSEGIAWRANGKWEYLSWNQDIRPSEE